MENEGKQLSLIYNKKITFDGLESTSIEKEYVVRKKFNQYSSIIIDDIRYLIFEDKKDGSNYTILGRKMNGGKFKNYFLTDLTIEKALELSGAKESINCDDMTRILERLVYKLKNHKAVFFGHVKKNYNITY